MILILKEKQSWSSLTWKRFCDDVVWAKSQQTVEVEFSLVFEVSDSFLLALTDFVELFKSFKLVELSLVINLRNKEQTFKLLRLKCSNAVNKILCQS